MGELHNNFSMNEADDCLRIVTTVEGWDKDYSNFSRSNGLYVLDEKLKTIGKIEDLAEGEQIKAARFMGDTGYLSHIEIRILFLQQIFLIRRTPGL